MFDNVRFVLVNTSHPGNIGSTARAIKTMGFKNLVLVAPKEHPSGKSMAMASGATDVLNNAVIVDTLEEAVKNCQLVIGTSSRQRRIPWPIMSARKCGEVVGLESQHQKIAIVFGREDRGLTNEELHSCHYHVAIDSDDDYGVLNVSQAVQVIAYELRMAMTHAKETENGGEPKKKKGELMPVDYVRWDAETVDMGELELFHEHFEQTLLDIGFYDPNNPKQILTRARRLFNRSRPDRLEINMLRGILAAVQKKAGTK